MCSPELARRKGATRPVTLIPNAVDVAAYRRPSRGPRICPDGPWRSTSAPCTPTGSTSTSARRPRAPRLGRHARAGRSEPARCRAGGTSARRGRPAARAAPARRGGRLPAACRRARGAARRDGFTDSLDPIKLYEYQAVGRPVVSTPVAGFRDADDPRITIASGGAFAAAVAAAVPTPAPFPDGADRPVRTGAIASPRWLRWCGVSNPCRGRSPASDLVEHPPQFRPGPRPVVCDRACAGTFRHPPPRLGVIGEHGDRLGERRRVVRFNEHTGRSDDVW